jgi:micrococcal nuclease
MKGRYKMRIKLIITSILISIFLSFSLISCSSTASNINTNLKIQATSTTQAQQSLRGIRIISLTSPISRGAYATISIHTSPNVLCSIIVYYKSGPSQAQGLEPKMSDGDGNCSWTWKVGTRTTPGNWRIVISAQGEGQVETYFTVTD